VGVRDNFFELGGDSILSIQIVSRAQERGLNISVQDLFQQATIEELAREVLIEEKREEENKRPEAFALISEEDGRRLPEGIIDAYPLTRLQAGMVFHSEFSPDTSIYHDIYSFQIRAHFDEGAMREAIGKLVNRHRVLRTSFDLTNFSEPL